MSVGILIDATILRSVVVPALISLFGPVIGWPGQRLLGRRHRAHE